MNDPRLDRYVREVSKAPRFTHEHEAELFNLWQKGDIRARNRLVLSNMRYVVAIAAKLMHYGMDIDDLIAAGNEGLMRALDKFEPDRGFKFVTYSAFWIRAYMQRDLMLWWSQVSKGKVFRSGLFFKLRREYARAMALLGDHEAARSMVAERVGIEPEKLPLMLERLQRNDLPLDAPSYAIKNRTIGETFESDGPQPDEHIEDEQQAAILKRRVDRAMRVLDRREALIVRARLMADDPPSLAELGRQFGFTRERARQLEARAKKKLVARLSDLRMENL